MHHLVVEPQEADRLAALSLESLKKLGVPAMPASFTILFVHHTGQCPKLSVEVAAMLANPATATTLLCGQIHDRFFGPEQLLSTLGEAVAGMARPIDAISQLMAETADHGRRFEEIGRDLTETARMSSGPTRDALDQAIGQLAELAAETARLRGGISAQIERSTHSLTKARRHFQTEHAAARTDPLTRIGNRRRLDEAMAASREGALIIADIDHFKRFNDAHGHKAGDLILMAFSRILRKAAGERGVVVRFGGEEFVIFLPAAPLAEAMRIADQARSMLEHMASISTRRGATLSKVTASFGVAASSFGDRPEALIEQADEALYKAKKGGRNRVASSETSR